MILFVYTQRLLLLSHMAQAQTTRNFKSISDEKWFRCKTWILLHHASLNPDGWRQWTPLSIAFNVRMCVMCVARNRGNIYHVGNLNQLNPLIRDNWWQFGSNKWIWTNACHAWAGVSNQLIDCESIWYFWLMMIKSNDKADVPAVRNRIGQLLRDMKWTPSPALHLRLMQYHRCPIDALSAPECQKL